MDHPASPPAASDPGPARHPPTPVAWRVGLAAAVLLLGGIAYLAADRIGPRGQAACGVGCFLGMIAACSANLRAVRLRTLAWGLALQVGLAWLILKFQTPPFTVPLGRFTIECRGRPGYELIEAVAGVVTRFLGFTAEGAKFVFGPLADPGALEKSFGPGNGFVFAFVALPTIIFVSSFFTVLYYLGVLQLIVRLMARVMMYLMGTSGAETLSAAANVFMGQTEAPLIVKPYVVRMTQSELLALMAGGMATVSGGIMALVIAIVGPENAPAILATSVMAAPCSLYVAKLLVPETQVPETHGRAEIPVQRTHANVIDAASAGASDGLRLALNVAGMLIAFLAFIALFDALLRLVHPDLTLGAVFARVFAPAAYLIGVEAKDVPAVANLLGTKLVGNEMVAFGLLKKDYLDVLEPRSVTLASYALTGFANFSSIGIQLGGIGAMAPSRRGDLARLGGRALLAGFTATLINAAIAGIMM
jgi:CNT family concentrative nucleoside transporter